MTGKVIFDFLLVVCNGKVSGAASVCVRIPSQKYQIPSQKYQKKASKPSRSSVKFCQNLSRSSAPTRVPAFGYLLKSVKKSVKTDPE